MPPENGRTSGSFVVQLPVPNSAGARRHQDHSDDPADDTGAGRRAGACLRRSLRFQPSALFALLDRSHFSWPCFAMKLRLHLGCLPCTDVAAAVPSGNVHLKLLETT